MLMIDVLSIYSETDLKWIPQDFIEDKSALVQVMALCLMAT